MTNGELNIVSKSTLFSQKHDEHCPLCGGELVIRNGGHGPFQGCANYPLCEFMRPLKTQSDGHIIKILEGQFCPQCHATLVLRQGRYGMFIGCSEYPLCQHIESTTQSNDTQVTCPQCNQGHLLQRKSRYGRTFYACSQYPTCQFTLNNKPVMGQCNFCHYPLLIEKYTNDGKQLCCASKLCGKTIENE